jgi:hypothetical protein
MPKCVAFVENIEKQDNSTIIIFVCVCVRVCNGYVGVSIRVGLRVYDCACEGIMRVGVRSFAQSRICLCPCVVVLMYGKQTYV